VLPKKRKAINKQINHIKITVEQRDGEQQPSTMFKNLYITHINKSWPSGEVIPEYLMVPHNL